MNKAFQNQEDILQVKSAIGWVYPWWELSFWCCVYFRDFIEKGKGETKKEYGTKKVIRQSVKSIF